MANEVKRMRYFDGLFLKQDEFNLEQDYHVRMRRVHNGAFHLAGVLKGLEVQAGPGTKEVTVTQGVALNRVTVNDEEVGQEIVLAEDALLDLSSYAADSTVYISIAYSEEKSDVVEEKGGTEEIHWLEKAVISHAASVPADKQKNIVLAKIKVKADATVDSASILYAEGGTAIRCQSALVVEGGLHVGGITDPGNDNLMVDGSCTIKGNLVVEGETTTVNTQNLVVEDNIITVNKGTPQNESGLEVFRGDSIPEAQLLWNEAQAKWKVGIKGSLLDLAYGNNAAGLTNNSVADSLHRHSKLVSANGLIDPVVSVDNSGNVGIGIAPATQKLDVNGKIRASSFIGSGGELTGLNGAQITGGVIGQAFIDPLIARKSDIGDITALRAEVTDARGIKLNLGNRLDESLAAGGGLRQHIVGSDQLTIDLAKQVNGALPTTSYAFKNRSQVNVVFTQANANNAVQTVTLGFRPKFVWAVGYGRAVLSGAWFGTNGHGYADLNSGIIQIGTAATITRTATAPFWIQDCGSSASLMSAYFIDQASTPNRLGNLNIHISSVTDTTLVLQLSRAEPSTTGSGQGLTSFEIKVQLMCFG